MPDWWTPVLREFAARVQSLGSVAPFRISSWLRTLSHNAEVGGATNSQHLIGTAVDLVPLGMSTEQLASIAQRSGLFAYVLDEGDHVHVQLLPASFPALGALIGMLAQ
jgi:uncharacterized protein YcbK (DUF882 family)